MIAQKTSRNAPCPCGSGKKFKKCCYDRIHQEPDQSPSSSWRKVRLLLIEETNWVELTLLHSLAWLRSNNIGEGSFLQVVLPEHKISGEGWVLKADLARPKTCSEGKVVSLARHPAVPLEIAEFHRRMRDDPVQLACELAPESERAVDLRLEQKGGPVEFWLVRSVEWLTRYGVREGGIIHMNMPGYDVCGEVRVLAIRPGEPRSEGPGEFVTGMFRYPNGQLKLEITKEETIGVTPSHPIWSDTRKAWVAAGDLRHDERVKTLNGTARVVSITPREEPEPVYNIEVEGDHVYRVGEGGVLVHNASFSPGCDPCENAETHTDENFTDRSGRTMRGTWEQINLNGVIQICRVRKVEGTIEITSGNTLDADNARRKMGHFFFNNNPPTNQSAQQASLSGQYDAGHLIANTLAGPNDVRNLVPMNRLLQQSGGAWRTFEQTWLQNTCLASSNVRDTAYMEIRVAYPNRTQAQRQNDPLPSYIPSSWLVILTLHSAQGNQSREHRFRFQNNATGRSTNFPSCL